MPGRELTPEGGLKNEASAHAYSSFTTRSMGYYKLAGGETVALVAGVHPPIFGVGNGVGGQLMPCIKFCLCSAGERADERQDYPC